MTHLKQRRAQRRHLVFTLASIANEHNILHELVFRGTLFTTSNVRGHSAVRRSVQLEVGHIDLSTTVVVRNLMHPASKRYVGCLSLHRHTKRRQPRRHTRIQASARDVTRFALCVGLQVSSTKSDEHRATTTHQTLSNGAATLENRGALPFFV